jgi:hypothetical protein
MPWMILGRAVQRAAAAARVVSPLLLMAGLVPGCGALDVSDPTAIEDSELDDANGAQLLRNAAIQQFGDALGQAALLGGTMADEFTGDPFFSVFFSQDRRAVSLTYGGLEYVAWQGARRAATVALPRLQAYAPPTAAPAFMSEMLAIRGFAAVHLAEAFCPGFPLHEIVDLKPVYGGPLSTEEVFERALANFDSAVAYAGDSVRMRNLAHVGRARTLLGLGRFSDATAAAAAVPTSYLANQEYSYNLSGTVILWNKLALGFGTGTFFSVANQEGGNGLDFVSAGDPRVQTSRFGTAFDGVTDMYAAAKYPDPGAPIVLASGIEARLIEAEAALNGGGEWLGILNDLRRNQITPALPDLTDPGSFDAQVDLLFRERAFWLFATGHRLGDLRRLIRSYGRGSESVFPTGAHRAGGVYETATNIPFPADLEAPFNAAVTGCTSR